MADDIDVGIPGRDSGEALPRTLAGMRPRLARGSAVGLKLALLSFLSLAMLIPLGMLSELTRERERRQTEAIEEASASWAGKLEVMSPVVVIPLLYSYRNLKNEVEYATRQVLLYPLELEIDARLEPELRKRGIFTLPLFSCDVAMSGSFAVPPLGDFGSDAVRLLWDKASFALPLSGFQALREAASVDWRGETLALDAPKPDMEFGGKALAARLGPKSWDKASFSLALSLRGSESLSFLPEAGSANVRLSSSWLSPSFFGSALPDYRTIGALGTEAGWRALRFGLGPRQLEGTDLAEAVSYGPGFGLSLFQPQGVYQKTDRAQKYGLVFVIIPFAAVFIFESLKGIHIHAVQYLFIGLANCLFFLLLLALSEHVPFDAAFAAAAAAVTILCSLYSAWLLPRKRGGLAMAAILAALYGYMFAALRSEDYALLIGSLGLLAILGIAMVATRKLDWYGMERKAGEKA